MNRIRLIALSCTILLVTAQSPNALSQTMKPTGEKGAKKVGRTMDNLQTAYYTESHESALYKEFAKKADEEGYGQLASMFRAIGRAEDIHAATKAALIEQRGGTPEMNSEPLTVMTTKENLALAMASESYEKDVMYDGFIEQARKEKDRAAEKVFRFAVAAEPTHQAMFKQALDDIEGYRGDNVQFLVCPGCGMTFRSTSKEACPTCSTPKERFEQIR